MYIQNVSFELFPSLFLLFIGGRGSARLPVFFVGSEGDASEEVQPPPLRNRVLLDRPDQLLHQLPQQPQEEQGLLKDGADEEPDAQPDLRQRQQEPSRSPQDVRTN